MTKKKKRDEDREQIPMGREQLVCSNPKSEKV